MLESNDFRQQVSAAIRREVARFQRQKCLIKLKVLPWQAASSLHSVSDNPLAFLGIHLLGICPMHTNIQQYFRYYLAAFLSILLAVGIRLQAAPLGSASLASEAVKTSATPVVQPGTAAAEVALR